jgi:hypothetical protein
MILYRPVGTEEFALIEQNGFKRFPPRLPEQPIFYPVTNEKYASEIAKKWNLKYNSEHKSYVLKFGINDAYIANYEVQTVGASYHQEYWIPAEEVDAFNKNIIGTIEVARIFE